MSISWEEYEDLTPTLPPVRAIQTLEPNEDGDVISRVIHADGERVTYADTTFEGVELTELEGEELKIALRELQEVT